MPDLLPEFPPRIARLPEIAANLSWSWHRGARTLFRRLNELLWVRSRYDPFELFRIAGAEGLARAAADAGFVSQYDSVVATLLGGGRDAGTWVAKNYPELTNRTIAYFCAEFALYHTVRIYSGGLGVLAGDHCKSASDLGVPLVGVGMLYRGGLLDQRFRADGWQEEGPIPVDEHRLSLLGAGGAGGAPGAAHTTWVQMDGREVRIRAWRLRVGRVSVFLLDTDLDANHPDDRGLLTTLYPGGPDRRLRQEWLLGVGGVRVLRALGVAPAVWHANEGHAAFMLIERVREFVAGGMPWDEAVRHVRNTSVFTTHTPVPAGHDVFPNDDVARCAGAALGAGGGDIHRFLSLGQHPSHGNSAFHMTAAAIRLSEHVNGVSKVHGAVTRHIWQSFWPDRKEEDVPIGSVTNGVHPHTWLAYPIADLLDKCIGGTWTERAANPAMWDEVYRMDDADLWHAHLQLKATLFRHLREAARAMHALRSHEATQLIGSGVLLDPSVLTIGFARRFTAYKRANLLFNDEARLLRILSDPARPVQIVFAGKAHPADDHGKHMLQRVYLSAHDPRFEGRIAFVEDYDLHIAHVLIQGVDAWLNVPRVPLEACGTSGMKAALNGVPHVSTFDGWWAEGFDGTNGWKIPTPAHEEDTPEADAATARALYDLLEREIVPAFYERDDNELPRRWIAMMKQAIRVGGSRFTAHRMLMDYVTNYYAPAATTHAHARPDEDPTASRK